MDFTVRNKDKDCVINTDNLDRQLTKIWAD